MEKESDKQIYNKKLIAVSFVAMFGVMLIHSGTIEDYNLLYEFGILNGIAGRIESTITDMALSANAFFFMSAAYHFYYGLTEEQISHKLRRRIHTLLIPYVIAVTVSIGYYWLIYIIPGLTERISMEKPNLSFIRIFNEYLNPKFDYPLWFMKYLMIYACLSVIILQLLKNKRLAQIIIGILVALDVFGIVTNFYVTWGSVYLVGAYKGLYSEKFEDGLSCGILNKYKNLSFIILVFYLIVFFFAERTGWAYIICLNIYKYISPFLLWSLSNRLIKFGTILQKHWWSQITFVVYSYHVLILPVLMKILYMTLPNNVLIGMASYILGPILTFAAMIVGSSIIRKNAMCWSLLTGGRGK